MTFDEKLRQLRRAAKPQARDAALERTLEYLRRLERPAKKLPAQRAAHSIEQYVEGRTEKNAWGEFFLASQSLPFGRPYGKMRIADVSSADLSPLDLFLQDSKLPETSRLVYLDTETTGLVDGAGTCAFLIGIGAIEGSHFLLRQFFLRDYSEEQAVLAALSEMLGRYDGLVTFNGKTFDVPLLEARYELARLKSPFSRLVHFDALHPARRLWRLRLERCELTHLERELLGISREGDVDGSEIPGIYFEYLRSGDAKGLQPIFYHNALDVVTLAALTVELARILAEEGVASQLPSLDLFSLSRILERAGVTDRSVAACRRALAAGLPGSIEPRALWQLASHHKRRHQFDQAVEIWSELVRREKEFALDALEELAIYHEHRRRDAATALQFAEKATVWLKCRESLESESVGDGIRARIQLGRFTRRVQRLHRKSARGSATKRPPIPG